MTNMITLAKAAHPELLLEPEPDAANPRPRRSLNGRMG
jgi:hypothetical protein